MANAPTASALDVVSKKMSRRALYALRAQGPAGQEENPVLVSTGSSLRRGTAKASSRRHSTR